MERFDAAKVLKAISQRRLIVRVPYCYNGKVAHTMFGSLARKVSTVLGIQRRRDRNFISFLNRLRLLRADPGYLFLSLCSRMWAQSQAQLFQEPNSTLFQRLQKKR